MPKNPKSLFKKNTSPLAGLVIDRILQRGSISVAEYMDLALGHPEYGYYISRNPFGASGDFITAPEISQMFGEMIGAWLVDIWMQMGRPEHVNLVELGPGRGTLAADIMRTISAWVDFKSAVKLHLVETSRMLRDVQAETLKSYPVTWHENIGTVPEGICLVVANEFFDALPVHQFEKTEGGWKERHIGFNPEKNEFFFTVVPLDFDITSVMPEDFLQAPAGNIFEISPASLGILEDIAGRVAEHGGAALIIDYGHEVPGLGDTVQAVSKHRYSPMLENPGEKDITAHVDFGTFKTVAGQTVNVAGPVTQGQFLIELGIESRAEKLTENAKARQRKDIMTALCRLVAPQDMGRMFKVMALAQKEARIEPAGFQLPGSGVSSHEDSDD